MVENGSWKMGVKKWVDFTNFVKSSIGKVFFYNGAARIVFCHLAVLIRWTSIHARSARNVASRSAARYSVFYLHFTVQVVLKYTVYSDTILYCKDCTAHTVLYCYLHCPILYRWA